MQQPQQQPPAQVAPQPAQVQPQQQIPQKGAITYGLGGQQAPGTTTAAGFSGNPYMSQLQGLSPNVNKDQVAKQYGFDNWTDMQNNPNASTQWFNGLPQDQRNSMVAFENKNGFSPAQGSAAQMAAQQFYTDRNQEGFNTMQYF